jgi:hypothetical protein
MMFKGTYSSDFYRALHDALHTEVDELNAGTTWRFAMSHPADTKRNADSTSIHEMWARVEQLEKTCRSTHPTLLPVMACSMAGSA